jgi:hypothetical protein
MAKNDESISYLLLEMDDFLGGSPTKLQNIADAIRDFKESEKKLLPIVVMATVHLSII